jgi:MORN repeat variant
MKARLSIAALFIAFACVSTEKETQSGIKNGIIKVYRADKQRLHKELSYKNDKLDGLSKIYHPNGNVYLETAYANDKRHGLTKQYFQSGILYSETQYDSGKITGILKKYHKDGKLKAEVPYNKGMECAGLKEYILNGEPRPHYPAIVITPENKILSEGYYYLHLSVSERVHKVTFYKGYLKDNCLHSDLEKVSPGAKNKAKLSYALSQGEFVMETVNFIAKIETIAGNTLVVQKSFNVAVQREF